MNRLIVPLPMLVLFMLGAGSIGCARYEYDIVQPQELARSIPSKTFTELTVEQAEAPALRYAMTSSDNHLVMRIHNPGDAPVKLLGEQSTAVDPKGQSHPLRGQTIAPQTFIKLILPPVPPRIEPSGPRFGIGIGGAFGSAHHFRHRHHHHHYGYGALGDPWEDAPRYYSVYDESSGLLWDWEGETQARLILVFQRGDEKPFTHAFTFRRRKV